MTSIKDFTNQQIANARSQFIYYRQNKKDVSKKEREQRANSWDENYLTDRFYYWFIKVCNPTANDDVLFVARRVMGQETLKTLKGAQKNFARDVSRGTSKLFLLANCWTVEDFLRELRLEHPNLMTAIYTIVQAILVNNTKSITTPESLNSVIKGIRGLVQHRLSEVGDESLIVECYEDLIKRNKIDIRPIQTDWKSHYKSSCCWGRELFVHQVASYAVSL